MEALRTYTLAVRDRVSPGQPYAIGLRLSDTASRELIEPNALDQFRRWLDENNCYVFTINGFPYGKFHGTRVKEQVYRPDWTSRDRLDYTIRLFEILARILPDRMEGSVSTLPGSFKEFITAAEQRQLIYKHLLHCARHIRKLSEKAGRRLHLGLEPEPLGLFENTIETVEFFGRWREENGDAFDEFVGVNYDTCHLAVEYEDPARALATFKREGIKISKLHLSSALRLKLSPEGLAALKDFGDNVYLHQVIAHDPGGKLTRHRDLDDAIKAGPGNSDEWRVHFHIPLHSTATGLFDNTSDHLLGVLDVLQSDPRLCSHLEMETYTWEVMPPEMKSRNVVGQLSAEYDWCLKQLRQRGLAGPQ